MNDRIIPPAISKTWLAQCAVAVISALLAWWIISPITTGKGWYSSIDGGIHLFRLLHFIDSFRGGGIWYPRWMARMYKGYGYPDFVFDQPGYYYINLFFSYFVGVKNACYTTLFLSIYIGIIGAYLLARLWHPRWLSLCFAIIFICNDWVSYNLILGDIPQLYAMMLCPINAYYILKLAKNIRSGHNITWLALGLIASTFVILITHPFVSFWWSFFTGGLIIFSAFDPQYNRRILEIGFICLMLALILAMPYWLSIIQLKGDLAFKPGAYSVKKSTNADVISTLVPFGLLIGNFSNLHNQWWIMQLMATAAGFVGTCRHLTARYTGLVFCLYFLLRSKESAWIWHLFYPALKYMQYCQRVDMALIPIGYIGMVLFGDLVRQWCGTNHIRICGAIAAACLAPVLTVYTAAGGFHLVPPAPSSKRLATVSFDSAVNEIAYRTTTRGTWEDEFLPKHALYRGLRDRFINKIPMAEHYFNLPSNNIITALPDSTIYHIHLKIDIKTMPESIKLNQFYFPGWKVLVNGKKIPWISPNPDKNITPTLSMAQNGCILLTFPDAGMYEIEAWYDGPPGWQFRNIAMVLCIMACALRLHHNIRRTGPANSMLPQTQLFKNPLL